PKKPKKKQENPIAVAVSAWLDSLPQKLNQDAAIRKQLLDGAPRRWVVYEPMVLLPSGSFAAAPWPALLSLSHQQQKNPGADPLLSLAPLWAGILREVSRTSSHTPLTHLAVNEGIPLMRAPALQEQEQEQQEQQEQQQEQQQENLLRTPSGLRMLHGDFGPVHSDDNDTIGDGNFASAFWVTTKQNGIVQTWAPRWTMFSRGNVKEKARVLGFPSRSADRARSDKRKATAVDLYAGIGYFVFSYARLGLRVLCWELNPWSVEGLRRGAVANGWSVRVVRPSLSKPNGDDDDDEAVAAAVAAGGEQIVVFLEDNARAARRVAALWALDDTHVLHVNAGLLPSSEKVWRDAWSIVARNPRGREEGWLHLHENAGVAQIEQRRAEMEQTFSEWCSADEEATPDDDDRSNGSEKASAAVEHVELVKTFAPDVWHCVFDVYITRS
ncbi:S-adenosyl-L-methionine-dependent methyltransferase, partial [Lasiosphaeria miniovina]